MAEGIAKDSLSSVGSFDIRSAGLHAVPGNPPFEYAVRVCSNHGISIASHRARRATASLISWADLIFCMERDQCYQVRAQASEYSHVFLLGEPVPGIPDEIDDPYGGGLKKFEQTFYHLTKAIAFHFGHYKEGRRYDRKAKAFG